jgi:hypothetical protein
MAGQLADCGFHDIVSYNVAEAIPLGRALVKGATETTVRLPNRNYATVTFDADFVASNVINGTVNSLAISPVTYASSHAATFAAVVSAFNALTGISAVAGTGRSIIITTDDKAVITVSGVVVTLGVSQAVATTVYTSSDIIYGVSVHTHTLLQDSSGVVQYAQYATVSTLKQGRIYVPVEQDVVVGDSVYMRTINDSPKVRGAFRKDADSGNALLISGARWFAGATSGNLAILELNLP